MHQVISFARFCFGTFGISLLLITQATVPASGQESAVKKQIEDLQKQIDTLTKKLEALRVGEKQSPGAVAATRALAPEWVKSLSWRSIGPAAMGGRITAIAVHEADPCLYFVATASGGLLKTVNNGITFEHVFDHENTVSVGDVCIAPSNSNIVWVGTGEANPRNSVSYGDGVYKSTDAGKTWKNMGLKESFQVGKILIHPKNPDIVYVGVLGRLYGPSSERGLFKTTDGGKTWSKILYIDDKSGVIDMRMHPTDAETLLVAVYERQRDGYDSHPGDSPLPEGYDSYDPCKKWGRGSGLYKTKDGGKTFRKITKGLPPGALGRIGLDWYRKNPNTVFAIIDCEKIGMGTPAASGEIYMGVDGEDAEAGAKLKQITQQSPAAKAGLQPGDIILSMDGKPTLTYKALVDQLKTHKIGDKIALKIARSHEPKDIVLVAEKRPSRGASTLRPNSSWYGGQAENIQDKQGTDGFQYGGVYKSSDAGESWTRINSVNPRPMYFSQIRVDPTDDKYLYVLGISLYRSKDGGKTFQSDGSKGVHPDQHALWIDPRDGRHMIVGCDGGFYVTYDRMEHWDFLNHMAIGQFYHVAVDHRRPYRVYGGLQDNGSWGGPSRTLRITGPINEDWIAVGGGDGFVCRVDAGDPDTVYWEFQDGRMFRHSLRTGKTTAIRPVGSDKPLFLIDWHKPFLIAFREVPLLPFLPNLKRLERYRFNWNTPFILSHHNSHIFYAGGDRVFRSFKQGEDLRPISPEIARTKVGTATALAESPRDPAVLYVGTDDGALWVTRDGGEKWISIAAKVGLPGPRWVASIEPSRFVDGRVYVAFDGHRSDDDNACVYVSEDYGATWKPLRANLPRGSTRVLREDVENPNLLFVGTEFAVYASLDRGSSWTKINSNLPTVAVHELAIHPTAGEMVAATHGRSLWVLDVTPLRQMTADAVKANAYLFRPNTVVRWRGEPDHFSMYGVGSRHFRGQNPGHGAHIYYSLTQKAGAVTMRIVDFAGKTVRELECKNDPGLQRVDWNLTQFASGVVNPGMYRVMLKVDGKELSQPIAVEPDPDVPASASMLEREVPQPQEQRVGRIDD